jgi:hypothetical protein
MMVKKVKISMALALALSGLASTIGAAVAAPVSVVIQNQGFNLEKDVVPINLKWSQKALALASKEQKRMHDIISNELAKQKNVGAVEIKRISHTVHTGVLNFAKLKLSPYLYSLNGYDNQGKLVRKSDVFFSNEVGVNNRTVYLKDSECIFRDFNIFDFGTWFKNKCAIVVESKSKFLQSAMQSWISLSGGFSADIQGVISELRSAQDSGLNYQISDSIFHCLNCNLFLSAPYESFPLEYKDGLWPYKIEVNDTNESLKLNVAGPNYENLISQISLSSNGVVRFDSDSTEVSKLFPPVEY